MLQRIRTTLLALALSWLGASAAIAQPSMAPRRASAPLLTPSEHALLMRGEITPGEHIGGGLLGTFFGLGLGHAVQGRYSDKGWIFTVGEAGSAAVLIFTFNGCISDSFRSDYGRYNDCNEGLLWGSALALAGFRIWELVDVWAGPTNHNQQVRNLQYRQGIQPRFGFFAAPTGKRSASAGLSFQF